MSDLRSSPLQRRHHAVGAFLVLAFATAAACGSERAAGSSVAAAAGRGAGDSGAAVAAPSPGVPPALPVDSALPPEEALRRFRAGLPAATRLEGGAPTRDSLVGLFVRAVESRDAALVNRLIVSRAEFAHLYYPTSPLREPPYELDPQMMWYQLRVQSEKGISRLFERLGARPLGAVGHRCPAPPRAEGENRVWEGCVLLRRTAAGDTVGERLFGSIVARAGRFKFVGYGNDL